MSLFSEQYVFQVADIRFAKDGFHIVRTASGVSVSGKFAARVGICYTSTGYWETHAIYGEQFKLESAQAVRMTNAKALGRFLAINLKAHGVGETVIGNLVEGCEDAKLDLEELLDRGARDMLIECVGTRNAKKIDILLSHWPKIKPKADLMSPLLGYGLTEATAEAAIAKWGNQAINEVENKPYELTLLFSGVAFLTADRIAMKVGRVKKTDAVRLRAAMNAGLRAATGMGDLGVRRKMLITKTMPLVNESVLENGKRKLVPGVELVVSQELLEATLDDMIKGVNLKEPSCGFSDDFVEAADGKGELVVWYKPLIEAENLIAQRLKSFCAKSRRDLAADVTRFAAVAKMPLAPEQRTAVEMALMHPVSIITGGPGVGKSATLKVLLGALDAAGYKGALAAPTGKAAKRITESTGRPAQTLHSLIGFMPGGGCAFNQDGPLVSQYLVIDEASMVDTELMAATLNAASNDCRIIIVGDVDQLASVGPGQVLRDIIRAKVVPTTRLTKVFRTGPGSGIVVAAKEVNRGCKPESTEDGQFVVMDTEAPMAELMVMARSLLAKGVAEKDIQVLAVTHKGDAGCIALNKSMQELLNPETLKGEQKLKRDSGDIRVGDRVIQLKNDRELKLVNGDIGWVDEIRSDNGAVVVSWNDKAKPILMSSAQAQNLSLAYAITVHKSQGSEAPYVLFAIDKSATFMLRRNLIYTGMTRASTKSVIFGSANMLACAVRRGEPEEGSRRTSLMEKIHLQFAVKPVSDKDLLAQSMLSEMEDLPF